MLDLCLPSSATDVAPGDIVLFRFPVAAGSGMVKHRPCPVVDHRSVGCREPDATLYTRLPVHR